MSTLQLSDLTLLAPAPTKEPTNPYIRVTLGFYIGDADGHKEESYRVNSEEELLRLLETARAARDAVRYSSVETFTQMADQVPSFLDVFYATDEEACSWADDIVSARDALEKGWGEVSWPDQRPAGDYGMPATFESIKSIQWVDEYGRSTALSPKSAEARSTLGYWG